MKVTILSLMLTLSMLYSCAQKKSGIETLIAENAKVEKVADGFSFTEGPAVDKEGNVYFTDQPNNKIMKYAIDGTLSTFMYSSSRSNGLFFDLDGTLLSCADLNNELIAISMDTTVSVIYKDYNGQALNGPNDLWVHPSGAIYFTDPLYERPYWTRDKKMLQDGEFVYYMSPDRKTVTRAAAKVVKPNGVVGTPDGKQLYIADIGDNKTYKFDIQPDGALTNQTLFCELGSDGMTIDEQGNLYLTGKGVTIFNKEGEKIGNIDIKAGWTANVCFGGKDRKTLFITAMDGLYTIDMKVKGVGDVSAY